MNIFDKIFKNRKHTSYIRDIVAGSLYKISDVRTDSDQETIRSKIYRMRALANDSQVSTALSFYATDSTLPNTQGNIIWATAAPDHDPQFADIVNTCFSRWEINSYVRDHILELATVGNLYIPTTRMFAKESGVSQIQIGLDTNTIKDDDFDIIPSYKIPPESVLHIYREGKSMGYLYEPEDKTFAHRSTSPIDIYPEESIVHFSLGGLLGDYKIRALMGSEEVDFDIKFADPIMDSAVQPTQTLNMLEDSVLLSSLIRVIKFINVDCGNNVDREEIRTTLVDIKNMIEQQMSLDTSMGDISSYLDPQSPNNLIYLAKVNGQEAISITDLNMGEATDADNKLLDYFQNKKLSVLGIPKEAMNYSSNEGLGGAGSVLSQRSSLYADSLQRLKTAYMQGWTSAFDKYFTAKGFSGAAGSFKLNMEPIITQQSTITFEKRDSAVSQAAAIIDLMKSLGVDSADNYRNALVEILTEALPSTASEVAEWNLDPKVDEEAADEF